ncbi:hypothetical protein L596_007062 [Steinernema carpocapsae]|uniref:Uncharacterized protein n=1 Tax=Steinernema carpocapsae TaxID=34508 RepID=A0A4U5P8I6_STECR|nr:hypothetical protein L596_007062 [Steinernema carpocapsae]
MMTKKYPPYPSPSYPHHTYSQSPAYNYQQPHDLHHQSLYNGHHQSRALSNPVNRSHRFFSSPLTTPITLSATVRLRSSTRRPPVPGILRLPSKSNPRLRRLQRTTSASSAPVKQESSPSAASPAMSSTSSSSAAAVSAVPTTYTPSASIDSSATPAFNPYESLASYGQLAGGQYWNAYGTMPYPSASDLQSPAYALPPTTTPSTGDVVEIGRQYDQNSAVLPGSDASASLPYPQPTPGYGTWTYPYDNATSSYAGPDLSSIQPTIPAANFGAYPMQGLPGSNDIIPAPGSDPYGSRSMNPLYPANSGTAVAPIAGMADYSQSAALATNIQQHPIRSSSAGSNSSSATGGRLAAFEGAPKPQREDDRLGGRRNKRQRGARS